MNTNFQIYQNIADNAGKVISQRIGLTGNSPDSKTPIAMSLWGRMVQAVKELFMKKADIRDARHSVMHNFKLALQEEYGDEAVAHKFHDALESIKGRSLRARDVKTIIDIGIEVSFTENSTVVKLDDVLK